MFVCVCVCSNSLFDIKPHKMTQGVHTNVRFLSVKAVFVKGTISFLSFNMVTAGMSILCSECLKLVACMITEAY